MHVRASAVFERGGKILCMKYVYGGNEVFALPGGGVDQACPLQEVLVNEWWEELGVTLYAGDIILIGEASSTKQHPHTLHIIFEAIELHGTPKVRSENTHSLDITWVPIEKLAETPLYPDVGKPLYEWIKVDPRRSLEFIGNCMEVE